MLAPRHGAYSCLTTFLTSFFLVALLAAATRADLVNVTVDDLYGDTNTGGQIVYTPSEAWNYGPNCTSCTSYPDVFSAYDQSWHDATYYPLNSSIGLDKGQLMVASYVFNGTSLRPK